MIDILSGANDLDARPEASLVSKMSKRSFIHNGFQAASEGKDGQRFQDLWLKYFYDCLSEDATAFIFIRHVGT